MLGAYKNKYVKLVPGIKALPIALAVVCMLLNSCINKSPSTFTRQLDPNNKNFELIWNKDTTLWFQDPIWSQNTVYAYTTTKHLISFDGVSGGIYWEKNLPIHESGVRALLVNASDIINLTTTDAFAYTTSFGDPIWATHLGDGHVPIFPQLEKTILRVYYGDRIIEISLVSGEILNEKPIGSIYWIGDNVEIHTTSPDQYLGMAGMNHKNWRNFMGQQCPYFFQSGMVSNPVCWRFPHRIDAFVGIMRT
jgi:hypothetical protein